MVDVGVILKRFEGPDETRHLERRWRAASSTADLNCADLPLRTVSVTSGMAGSYR
jgi:hypothetical protein